MTCPTCALIQEQSTNLLYQDSIASICISNHPSSQGHLQVIPTKHITKIEELSEQESTHMWHLASYSATVLFETLKAQGTNIILNSVDFEDKHLVIDVIARTQDDGLNFLWDPKKLDETTMSEVAKQIKDKLDVMKYYQEHPNQNKEHKDESSHTHHAHDDKIIKQKKNEIDYRIKHFERLP